MTKALVELRKALDQFPKPRTWIEEDCEDSSRDIRCDNFLEVQGAICDLKEKFAVFQQELSLSQAKNDSLTKRAEVWLGACQESRKGPQGCFVTTYHEEWFCKDCKKVFDETFCSTKQTNSVLVDKQQLEDHVQGLQNIIDYAKNPPRKFDLIVALEEYVKGSKRLFGEAFSQKGSVQRRNKK